MYMKKEITDIQQKNWRKISTLQYVYNKEFKVTWFKGSDFKSSFPYLVLKL